MARPNVLRLKLDPGMYQGLRRTAPYFEGWYYKLVSADETQCLAVIPGVILGENGHAFVQILDGATSRTAYHTLPLDQLIASRDEFDVRVSDSRFALDRIHLNVNTTEGVACGDLRFVGTKPWPVTLASPGIMGWYAWVPSMECYHGVLSLDHAIEGTLTVDNQVYDFTGGRGYIEKDWGKSFPAAWIWLQSNHFCQAGTSVTASVALIPWRNRIFRGFIVGLWHEQRLYRFATYTGARIEHLDASNTHVRWAMRRGPYTLELTATRAAGGMILGPTVADMSMRVHETLNATVHVRLAKRDRVIYEGVGRHAGLEVQGDLAQLVRGTPH